MIEPRVDGITIDLSSVAMNKIVVTQEDARMFLDRVRSVYVRPEFEGMVMYTIDNGMLAMDAHELIGRYPLARPREIG